MGKEERKKKSLQMIVSRYRRTSYLTYTGIDTHSACAPDLGESFPMLPSLRTNEPAFICSTTLVGIGLYPRWHPSLALKGGEGGGGKNILHISDLRSPSDHVFPNFTPRSGVWHQPSKLTTTPPPPCWSLYKVLGNRNPQTVMWRD